MLEPKPAFYKLGLIGHPVSHSISPLMHRAALSFSGLDGTYELIDIVPRELDNRVPELLRTFSGLNVTVPHKQAILPLLSELTEIAVAVGAVNTVRCEEKGRTIGHNTDVEGFTKALSQFLAAPLGQLRTVCVTGSGGASRAAVYALLNCGISDILVIARNIAQTKQLLSDLNARGASAMTPEEVSARFTAEHLDLVINCIPFGLTSPVPAWYEAFLARAATLNPAVCLYDMVYKRDRTTTALCDVAARYDINSTDGLQMLIEQALLAFEFWTGRQVPASVMTDAALIS